MANLFQPRSPPGGNTMLEAEKCATPLTAKLPPWHALLEKPFWCIQIFTGFPAPFVKGTFFKKCYFFSLWFTVSTLLRGSLQKTGFLWCIPKCLGERNCSGVWINPASSACQKNSATLHCWYMPRCTGCGWSPLLLLLLLRTEICFTMWAVTRLKSMLEVVVNIKH